MTGRQSSLIAYRLEGPLIPFGTAGIAFALLRDWMTDIGSKRASVTIDTIRERLVGELGSGPGKAPGSDSAEALIKFRARLAQKKDRIDLTPFGAGIAPLPIEGLIDDARVRLADEEDETAIAPAIRRWQRFCLVGLPGSGKSTAIEQVAAFAADRDDWPVPIFASLKLVAQRADGTIIDRMIEVAAESVEAPDRAHVVNYLHRELRSGRALLLLDGLDECRHHTTRVVGELRDALPNLHPDVEVVITTREITATAAGVLGLPTFHLSPPSTTDDLVESIVRAVVTEASFDPDDQVHEKVAWVKQLLNSHRDLRQTPLVPVLLSLLAAGRGGDLPTTRAGAIAAVVDEVVSRWEIAHRYKGEIAFADLAGAAATAAVREGFDVIAHSTYAVAEPVDVSVPISDLASLLRNKWGLPDGRAAAAASEMLDLWDGAGTFVLSEDRSKVRARLRILEEIGEARWATSQTDPALEAWVAAVIDDPQHREVVRLACGMDRRALEAVTTAAVASQSDEAFDKAIAAVAEHAPDNINLAAPLVERVATALTGTDHEVWHRARGIFRLPVSPDVGSRLIEVLRDALPETHVHLGLFQALNAWNIGDDDVCLAAAVALLEAPRPRRLRTRGEQPMVTLARDSDEWSNAYARAARMALAARPDLAETVAAQLPHASQRLRNALSSRLTDIGRDDLVPREDDQRITAAMASTLRMVVSDQEGWSRFFDILSSLASPATLSWRQRRSVEELAELFAILGIPDGPGGWVGTATNQHPEAVSQLLDSAVAVLGLDPSVIAAEAAMTQDDHLLPLLNSPAQRNTEWRAEIDPVGLQDRLLDLIGLHEWITRASLCLILYSPARADAANRLRATIDNLADPTQREAAATFVVIVDDTGDAALEWSGSEDPVLRACAASALSRGGATGGLEALLFDIDASVREAAARAVRDIQPTDAVRAAAEIAHGKPPEHWTCTNCGERNRMTTRSCSRCNLSGPDLTEIERLIDPPANSA